MSYYQYIRKNVYPPAGMNASGSFWKTEKTPNLARGYTAQEGPPR